MAKRKFILMSVALLALSAIQLNAAKELKLAARYDYSPDGQLQSVLTPVSDNGAVKTSYSRSYLSDGKIKVSVHKKNLEFNELAFSPVNGAGLIKTGECLHDYNEALALYQVASKGDIAPTGLDKGILVREYIEKAGRKLEETDMLGNTSKYHYNKLGQLVKVSSFGEGNEDNGQGRALPVPSGGTAGRPESETSFSTSFSYDKYGRLDKTQDALGRVSGRVYDPEGRVAQMINPLDEKSFVNYDKYGRVASRSGAGGYPLSFEYNSFGEIIAYTDGNGAKTKFEYDIAGRLVKRIWPDGAPVTYSYNDRGLLSKKVEADRITGYTYDSLNRLVKIEISEKGRAVIPGRQSSSVTNLVYSNYGKLIEISDESGRVNFSYDSFGRVTSETGEIGVIKYEYNNLGLLSAKECMFSHKDTKSQSFRTDYSYDNFDRITQVTSPAGTYSYKYDNKGRIASLASSTPGGTSSTSSASFTVNYSYDKAGRLVSKSFSPAVNGERSTENGTLLCSYEYDKLDRRVKAEVNGVKWVYGYDNFNQLTSASSSDGYVYGYDFDPIGNRKYASLSEKGTEKFKTDFEYNGLNQIAKQGFQYDAYGNLIQANDTKYSYDLHNRLTEVKKTSVTVKYGYDPLGQRIKSEIKTVNGEQSTVNETKFLMSGMVEQARITDNVSQFHTLGLDLAGSLTATGAVGAVLASSELKTGNLTPDTFSYLYDGNGNIISACNSKGEITAKLVYSPFGEKISGTDLPFSFSTKAVDVSGLAYYGYRFYNPELGRWLSRDPADEQGGLNIYNFTANAPISNIDLKGEFSFTYGLNEYNSYRVCSDACSPVLIEKADKIVEEYKQAHPYSEVYKSEYVTDIGDRPIEDDFSIDEQFRAYFENDRYGGYIRATVEEMYALKRTDLIMCICSADFNVIVKGCGTYPETVFAAGTITCDIRKTFQREINIQYPSKINLNDILPGEGSIYSPSSGGFYDPNLFLGKDKDIHFSIRNIPTVSSCAVCNGELQ